MTSTSEVSGGGNITFTDALPKGPPASDDLILGLSTMVFVAIIVGVFLLLVVAAAGLWWKFGRSSGPQQGNEAGGRPNGQGEEARVYVARD